MIKYKLTTQDLKTYNGFQWKIGQKVKTSGEGDLCSSGWLHYYHHPLLAVLLNPIHGNFNNPKLWEVNAEGEILDDKGLKGGCTELTLVKELPLPQISQTQKVAFAILLSKKIFNNVDWNKWADNWLSGKNRTSQKARAAARTTMAAALAVEWTEARAAETAAMAAARAAETAARAVAIAAEWGTEKGKGINLIEIAEEAMKY